MQNELLFFLYSFSSLFHIYFQLLFIEEVFTLKCSPQKPFCDWSSVILLNLRLAPNLQFSKKNVGSFMSCEHAHVKKKKERFFSPPSISGNSWYVGALKMRKKYS